MKRAGLVLGLLMSGAVDAHPLAPALLELRERGGDVYELLWRTSATRARGADVRPEVPGDCRPVTPMQTSAAENQSLTVRWRVQCEEGLPGRMLAVSGLDRSRINVIVRFVPVEGAVSTALLDAATPEFSVPQVQAAPPVFGAYVALGIRHLALGLDHILFVAGLVLLVPALRSLLVTVTAFTLGHSATLALAVLGAVRLDPRLTELGIALSIVVLALELARPSADSLFRRRPWAMAGAFGLLHGLGFAGALSEVGLPAGDVPMALFAFNLGIEAGQLAFVAGVIALGMAWKRLPPLAAARSAAVLPAYVIGSLGAYWCFERAAALALL